MSHAIALTIPFVLLACGQPAFINKEVVTGTTQGTSTSESGDAVAKPTAVVAAASTSTDSDTNTATSSTATSSAATSPAPTSTSAATATAVACDATAGSTQAEVKSAQTTSSSITIVYKIYRTDCNGDVLPLSADRILFDVDAVVSGFGSINYAIAPDATSPGSGTQDGTMQDVPGSDLFGDTGPNYAHWETDQGVSVVSDNDAIDLTVSTDFVSSLDSTGLATYLAFGDAAPVKVVVPL